MKIPKTEEKALVSKLLVLLDRLDEWKYDGDWYWKHTSGVVLTYTSYGHFSMRKPTRIDFGFWRQCRLKLRVRRVREYINRKNQQELCQKALTELGNLVPNKDIPRSALDYEQVGGDAPEKGAWMN